MAIKVPSPASAGQKWAQVTPTRQQYYQSGVTAAGPAWQAGVDGAEGTWQQGVSAAAAANRYSSGVSGKGSKYSSKAASIGTPRWGQGVAAAEPAYEQAVAKFFNVLAGLNLPPRGPVGSAQNLQRVQMVDEALHAAR
jgi:hypothetical protein